jgi:hypothetical protein
MSDHRSSEGRLPEWAVLPVTVGLLLFIAAAVFAVVAIGFAALNY